MSKLTKGQKNELIRIAFQERADAIKQHGYTIRERIMGARGYVDSYSYYIYKDGVELQPGCCWDYKETAVKYCEKLINP